MQAQLLQNKWPHPKATGSNSVSCYDTTNHVKQFSEKIHMYEEIELIKCSSLVNHIQLGDCKRETQEMYQAYGA